MGILTSILPTTSAIAQHGQVQSQTAKPQANVAQQSVQQAVQSGQATVVSLTSTDNKNRVASYGEGRSADPSFEKQRTAEDKKETETKAKTTANPSVNVSA
jgi:hypothetical protein